MPEYLLDDTPEMRQFVTPDEKGFTLRTEYKDTQRILDDNARMRNEASRTYRENGQDFHLEARLPTEVWEKFCLELGRMPTAKELKKFLKDRDYSKLRTSERKL